MSIEAARRGAKIAPMRYSLGSLLVNAVTGNRNWKPIWREPEPKPHYDVVIVGGGGHGLATAITSPRSTASPMSPWWRRSYIGSGNVGRNTTIVRSNYLLPGNLAVLRALDEAVGGARAGPQLQRHGQPARRAERVPFRPAARRLCAARQRHAAARRRCRAARPRAGARSWCRSSISTMRAFPFAAGCCSRAAARCGTTRSPGAMPAPPTNAASTSSRIARRPAFASRRARARASRPRRASSAPTRWRWPCAGNSTRVASMAGLRLPIESHVGAGLRHRGRQARDRRGDDLRRRTFLCQPVRQRRAGVRRRYRGLQFLRPARQSAGDRGRVRRRHGADAGDRARCASCAPGAGCSTCRWTARRSSTRRRFAGLYLNAGWCYGGFKATPASGWCFAHLIAKDEPHPIAAAYRLDRFAEGAVIDEKGMGAQPNLH